MLLFKSCLQCSYVVKDMWEAHNCHLLIFSSSDNVLVPNSASILNLECLGFEITSNPIEFHKSLAALQNDDWVFPT